MADDATICTFHSLCVRILRTCIERLGYKKTFSIYTASDQLGLLKRIIVRKLGKDESMEPKMASMMISTIVADTSGVRRMLRKASSNAMRHITPTPPG